MSALENQVAEKQIRWNVSAVCFCKLLPLFEVWELSLFCHSWSLSCAGFTRLGIITATGPQFMTYITKVPRSSKRPKEATRIDSQRRIPPDFAHCWLSQSLTVHGAVRRSISGICPWRPIRLSLFGQGRFWNLSIILERGCTCRLLLSIDIFLNPTRDQLSVDRTSYGLHRLWYAKDTLRTMSGLKFERRTIKQESSFFLQESVLL